MLKAAPIALACVLGLAGCSLGGGEQPRPARGAPREVASLVAALDRATRAHDWRRICADLLTSSARRRAGGADCPRLMRSAAGDLRRPRIELVAITVAGNRASARVRTRAVGQAAAVDTLQLVLEGGGYRIDALAD